PRPNRHPAVDSPGARSGARGGGRTGAARTHWEGHGRSVRQLAEVVTVATVITVVLVALSVAAVAYAAVSQLSATRARRQPRPLPTDDALTGLPNRFGLNDELDQLGHKRSTGMRGALLLVQLDRFAAVNDTYGHDVGDQLMVAAAKQLQQSLQGG